MKISKRLTAIDAMITTPYDQIWDCCCDHGFLGMHLLARDIAKEIHFVDIVPSLITKLEHNLLHFCPEREAKPNQQTAVQVSQKIHSEWFIHCQDVATLPLPVDDNKKILIIIAGVGGDLLSTFIQQINQKYPHQSYPHHNLEFIICPVHHNFKVRETLIEQELGLIGEAIIKDNKRFYEVIHVSQKSSIQVSNIGSKMWNLNDKEHQEYLAKTIAHYQRMANQPNIDNERIIQAYSQLKES